MVALVLASEVLRKFGGDSLAEVLRNHRSYVEHLHETPSASPFPRTGGDGGASAETGG
jgi:hypothetical protein